jgi:sterol desaturase/sphingolipid hydroxylase (fatty acid hydroxylase superfamily)
MIYILYWATLVSIPYMMHGLDMYILHKGLCSVLLGQILTIAYFLKCSNVINKQLVSNTLPQIKKHITQPEGLILLGSYLIVSWEFEWLPSSYYDSSMNIRWSDVFYQLLCQDGLQYIMHRIEHWSVLYKYTHVYHHKHIHPTLYDAFDGSISDTLIMIIIPLIVTSRIINTNAYSYIMFGTLYSSLLTLIHSDHEFPWEPAFQIIGIGTSSDHQMHHLYFKSNYGHIFMYWDYILGTFRPSRKIQGINDITHEVKISKQ